MLKAVCVQTAVDSVQTMANDLLAQSDQQLGVYRPQAGMLFVSCAQSAADLSELLTTLQQHYPGIQLIACTVTAGFTTEAGYLHDGCFLCLLVSNTLHFQVGMVSGLSELQNRGQFTAVFDKQIKSHSLVQSPGLCLAYPAYYQVDGERLVADVQQVVGEDCLVFGGCSTDYWPAEQVMTVPDLTTVIKYPWQKMLHGYSREGKVAVEADAMPYLLVAGQFEYTLNYTCGWLDSGDRFPVSVDGTTLTRIDEMDAYQFLLKMGHPLMTSQNFIEYPLWIHEKGKEPYQRAIFLDRTYQRVYTGFIPLESGVEVSFSYPDRETLLNEQRTALRELTDQYDLSLMVGCAARIIALREDIGLEADQHGRILKDSPLLGAYTFGEIFPRKPQAGADPPKASLNSASSATLSIRASSPLLTGAGEEHTKLHFLQQMLAHKNQRLADCEQQLEFFENSKFSQENLFLKDCLGLLLSQSDKSVSAFSEKLESIFKQHYQEKSALYPVSRGKLIAKLNPLRKAADRKFSQDE